MANNDSQSRKTPPTETRRTLFRFYGRALILILAFMLLPIISVAISSSVASVAGCTLNEAAAHPCVIVGVDFGGLLYGMGVLGWLMLLTIPYGGIMLLCWLIAVIVQLGMSYFRRRRE